MSSSKYRNGSFLVEHPAQYGSRLTGLPGPEEEDTRHFTGGFFLPHPDASPEPDVIFKLLRSRSAPLLSEPASSAPPDSSPWDQNQNPRDLERPYRIRVHRRSRRPGLSRTAKNLMSVTSSEHDLTDIVHALPKPPSAASIPSKCR